MFGEQALQIEWNWFSKSWSGKFKSKNGVLYIFIREALARDDHFGLFHTRELDVNLVLLEWLAGEELLSGSKGTRWSGRRC